ncbi:hypothetical protein EEB18_005525 [Sphingopyxis sp. OPL5]|uniref:hypothetical protein n=1 Tax=Sphingopyxis sp. OPL5 TaxID=2486273 RepID=UPI00164EBBA2|nr:hypothetical protein [Sphingopyxis sp. OPL5]QNO28414.1 hypothetical protein EEB18_005525 [Sphingopyxis sp. OPL5]
MSDIATGYTQFLEAAREVEAIIRAHPGTTDADLAEGYHYLSGMWIFHVERAFKSYDVDRPAFVRDMDNVRTWGLPTPDHHYYSAQIDGTGVYRLFGNRGTTVDYCFELVSGLAGDDGVVGDRIGVLESSRLQIEADGHFELWIGGPERPGNWMPCDQRARCLFVRQTVNDWLTEQPTPMLIERMDKPTPIPRRPALADVQKLYAIAAKNMVDQVRFLDDFAQNWGKILPVNAYPAPSVGPADAGYFPGQYNTKGRWEVPAGKALVITIEPNDARYQSLALAHPLWFNSLSPRSVQSSITGAQSLASSDGRFRYVIAGEDPGVWNWLDTTGITSGFIFMRFQQLASRTPPGAPQTRLVSLAAVRDAFPADEPRVSPTERQAISRLRRLSADRRYA